MKISKLNNKPLKNFGQNYIVDKNTVIKFVHEFNPQKNDNIIEIGPGRGAITSELLSKSKSFTAIEIDKRIIESLSEKYPNVNFVNKDFLKVDLTEFLKNNQKFRIIGNIPFNLTSSILFKFIENRNLISDALIIVQYEVAKRMVAKPDSKDYGILSVILNYLFTISLRFKISPNVFFPKPNVSSAAIQISFNKTIENDLEVDLFIQVVKASFGNRRKTLKNSLNNSIFKNCNFNEMTLDFSKRAENLTISDYIELTQFIQNQNCYGEEKRRDRS